MKKGIVITVIIILLLIFIIPIPKESNDESKLEFKALLYTIKIEKNKDIGTFSIDAFGHNIYTYTKTIEETEEHMYIYLKIEDHTLPIRLIDNSSSKELLKKLEENDITLELNDYGNFEKVGDLGFDLPRNDENITTEPGDIILYLGNKITIYYDVNTWNFTKLGHIDDISKEELKKILGPEDVTVTFSISK